MSPRSTAAKKSAKVARCGWSLGPERRPTAKKMAKTIASLSDEVAQRAVHAGRGPRSGRHATTLAPGSASDNGLGGAVRRSRDPIWLHWVAAGPEMLDGPHSLAARSAQRWPMLSERTTGAATDELLHAAAAVQQVDHGAGVVALPSELEALAEALRDAGSALATSASRVVPPAKPQPITASAAATNGPRRAGRPRRRPPTKGSPPRWHGSTTLRTQRGWQHDAATKPGGPSRRCSARPVRPPQ